MGQVLVGDDNANTLTGGDEDDLLVGNNGADTLNGGGGDDTVDYSLELGLNGARIDLLLEENFDTWNARDSLISIETIIGTFRADDLRGDFGANTLRGGGGNDLLSGRGGGDRLVGGEGDDTYLLESNEGDSQVVEEAGGGTADKVQTYLSSYTLAAHVEILEGIRVGEQTLTGGANGDIIRKTLSGSGYLSGLAGNDTLTGGTGVDTVDGGLNDDALAGGAGADLLYGDAGSDTARYDLEGGGGFIVANLLNGTAKDSYGSTDTLFGIENVTGAGGQDQLTGDGGVNVLNGVGGSDTLDGGGGDDVLIGGAGADTLNGAAGVADAVDYYLEGGTLGVVANLALGTSTDTFGATDTLQAVEGVRGSAFNDVLLGNGSNNALRGATGDDTLVGGQGADTLNGGGGLNDLLDYSQEAGLLGVTADLTGGVGIDTFGNTDVYLALEHITGTTQADRLIGQASANRLKGEGGADVLVGGAGADTLDGGSGATDQVDYFLESGTLGIVANLATQTSTDTFGATDILMGVEWLRGGAGDDLILGSAGANELRGAWGDDVVVGGDGADLLNGGFGANDLADYYLEGGSLGVVASLALGTATDTFGATDTLLGLENIRGGPGADRLTGDALANQLRGATGDDTLVGGAGADTLNGGSGANDTVDYSQDGGTRGVVANLANGTAIDSFGAVDTLLAVERLVGSAYADALVGDASSNRLSGGAGSDAITGGLGADVLIGGSDGDQFYYFSLADSNASALDDIQGFEIGLDKVDISALRQSAQATFAIVAEGSDTLVFVDGDGDGTQDFVTRLSGVTGVTSGDIIWS